MIDSDRITSHPSQRNNVCLLIYASVFKEVTNDLTVEGSFNHDGLVAVERHPFLIIYVGKEDGRTHCNSWK